MKLVNRKKHNAFSLIELSIVLLIIGILIAGVTQSSRLVAQARLSNAKTLTQSSPVSSIVDLVAWLETTTDASFIESEQSNGNPISEWRGISPQALTKTLLKQTTVNARPTYVLNTSTADNINGLPVLKFDGTDDVLIDSDPGTFSGINKGAATVFFVIKTPSLSFKTSVGLLHNFLSH